MPGLELLRLYKQRTGSGTTADPHGGAQAAAPQESAVKAPGEAHGDVKHAAGSSSNSSAAGGRTDAVQQQGAWPSLMSSSSPQQPATTSGREVGSPGAGCAGGGTGPHHQQLPEDAAVPTLPLHAAAAAGDTVTLGKLLEKPATNITTRMPDGSTALHAAAAANQLQAVKMLAEAPGRPLVNLLDGHGRTALVVAIHLKHLEVVHYLNNLDRRTRHFRLHFAAQHGHLQAVQEALAQGAPPDLTDEAGFTPLHRACKHGHTAAVKELLATRKVDVDAQTKAGWTPMLLAAASGAVEVVRVLLQHARDKKLGDYSLRQQVPANADTDGGLDVVLLAAKYGHYDVVKTALDSGASVLTSDPAGNTALHLAVVGGTPEHMAIMQLLLERGAAHDATNEACYTPLLLASGHDEFCRCPTSCSHPDMAKELVRRYGWSFTHLGILPAAHKGDLAEVQRYLRCQCDTCITSCPSVALCCSKGLTALLVAAKAGRAAVVEALLGAHADIEAAMQGTGETALMLAAGQCHPEVVRVLLAAGAKVFSRDTKGANALHHVCTSALKAPDKAQRQAAVLQLLLQAAAAYRTQPALADEVLVTAAADGAVGQTLGGVTAISATNTTLTTTTTLPKAPAAPKKVKIWEADIINAASLEAVTPLMAAVAAGSTPLVDLLLRNVQVNVTAEDKDGALAIHWAARGGQLDTVKLLLAAGSPVLPTDGQGNTPLHGAAAGGHQEVVTYLLKAQDDNPEAMAALVDITNDMGWTPLHVACEQGQPDMLQLLIRLGADPLRTTGSDACALSLPRRNAEGIAAVLLEVHRAKGVPFRSNKAGWNPLILAVMNFAKTPLLQRLLEHMEANWDPEEVVKMVNTPLTREPRGWCPLHIAASGGQLQAVRVLLEPGKRRADVHFSVNTPALHLAAFGGHKDVCQLLLDAGADVDSLDEHGRQALSRAVHCNECETAELLLAAVQKKHGTVAPALNWVDRSNGFCPIHYAAVRGHIEVVQLLQRYQQDLEQRTRSGRTPLELAAAFGQGELLQYLLSKNCAIESVPRPLQPVKHKWHTQGACRIARKESKIYVEDGEDVVLLSCPMPASRGLSYAEITVGALHHSTGDKDPRSFQVMVGAGIDCYQLPPSPGFVKDTFGYDGSSGMLRWRGSNEGSKRYGTLFGPHDTIGVLLNHATRTVSFTRNAQHLGLALSAHELGPDIKLEAVSLLVLVKGVRELTYNLGLDSSKPFLCSMDDVACGEEELHCTVGSEPWRFKDRLHAIHLAACSRSAPVLRTLLEAGAACNQEDADGWTPMHFAALAGWSDGIEVLLQHNRDMLAAADRPGQGGNGAEHTTAAEVMKHAAYVNQKTKANSTPLRFTVKSGHLAASRTLITKGGADCLVRDSQSRTLLMLAAGTGSLELMELLIRKGVAVKAKDTAGRTAMQYACNAAAAEYLEKQSNETIPYPGCDWLELRVDSSVKQGAVGLVLMGKLRSTGEKVAIKYHSRQDHRDDTYRLLTSVFGGDREARQSIACVPLSLTEGEARFDDPDKFAGHPAGPHPYALVLEGGDQTLQDILDELGPTEGQTVLQLPENEARFIFGCLVTALEEVHSRGYTHHDVKAANFVRFYDGKYKLIDFDNTRLADKEPAGNTTPEIAPPEVARHYNATKAGSSKHKAAAGATKPPLSSQSMDMWSLGCVLYQLVTRRRLVADLAGWEAEEVHSANDAMKVLAQVKEAEVVRVVKEYTSDTPLQQAAQELLLDLLKVQPGARLNIAQVANSPFLGRGVATLRTIADNMNRMDHKMDTLVTLVTDVRDRLVPLSSLPAQLQAGFNRVSGEINSFRKMVLQVHKAVCPTTFIIGPDLPLGVALDTDATTQALTSWTHGLSALFSRKLSLNELTEHLTHESYRLQLVCESCGVPQGEGYSVKKPREWVPKMLPAMQVSLTVAKIANVGLGIASIMFPGVPQIPDAVLEAGDALVGSLSHKSSAEEFACIQDALDEGNTDGQAFQRQVDAGLRQLAAFLATVDPTQTWGGLALMDLNSSSTTAAGSSDSAAAAGAPSLNSQDVLWVCKGCLTGKCGGDAAGAGGSSKGASKGNKRLGTAVSIKETKQAAQIQELQARIDGLQKYIRANGLAVPTAADLSAITAVAGASNQWDATTIVQVAQRISGGGGAAAGLKPRTLVNSSSNSSSQGRSIVPVGGGSSSSSSREGGAGKPSGGRGLLGCLPGVGGAAAVWPEP